MIIGHHCIWDVYNCDSEKLSFVPHVEKVLNKIVDELKLTKVSSAFKQFEPVGVTGFILLAESHISIHTWPEHNFAAIDVFSCNSFNIDSVKNMLQELFGSNKVVYQIWERGNIPHATQKNAYLKQA